MTTTTPAATDTATKSSAITCPLCEATCGLEVVTRER